MIIHVKGKCGVNKGIIRIDPGSNTWTIKDKLPHFAQIKTVACKHRSKLR